MAERHPRSAGRRNWMKAALVAGAGGAALGAGSAAVLKPGSRSPVTGWRFFAEDEARLVEAISEQIIPTDRDAGATEAGVVIFIDRQLVGPYQRYQETYRAGLAQLQATCRLLYETEFTGLGWDEQTAVLQMLEAGTTPKSLWKAANPRTFFRMIRDHAMQGFYGSPRHGGNRGYVSYQMLGLEYPRVLGQNRYRESS